MHQINLLTPDLLPRPDLFPARLLLALLGAIVLLSVPVAGWFWWQAELVRARHERVLAEFDALSARADRLDLERQTVADAAAEDASTMDTSKRQLLARLQDIATHPSLSARLAALSHAALPGVWLSEITLRPHAYRLQGYALAPGLLPTYLQRLTQQPAFAVPPVTRLSVQAAENEREAKVTFTLDAGGSAP